MIPKFKIGEVAIFIGKVNNATALSVRYGESVTIGSYGHPFIGRCSPSGRLIYHVSTDDGRGVYCLELDLEKRPDEHQQRFRDTLIPAEGGKSLEGIIADLNKVKASDTVKVGADD